MTQESPPIASPEFIGMIHHRQASEIHPASGPIMDLGYIRTFAQAAEAGGFDRLLVGYFSDAPDGFLVAASAASHTERVGFLVAHRPGFVAPTLAARKFATLDQITDGRAAIHVISGGDDTDQARDGDYLGKDERYARTDEYVGILKRIWTEQGPISHSGQYYRFDDAHTAMRTLQQPRIPIYFGGASEAASQVAGKHADVYALWGETYAQVREITARVRPPPPSMAATVRFSLSLPPDPGRHRGCRLGSCRTHQAAHHRGSRQGRPRPGATRSTKAPAGCSPRQSRASGWTSASGRVRRS